MELVKFSELAAKEVINLDNGRCLGVFADCDLTIDPNNGKILEVVLAGRSGLSSLFFRSEPTHVVPWSSIVRIGVDTIILALAVDKD